MSYSATWGLLVTLLSSTLLCAQEIPNQVLPGTLDKTFEQNPTSQSTGKVVVPSPSVQVTPTLAGSTKFILNSVSIAGNTVFQTSELTAFYHDYIGKQVSLANIFDVANEITNHYAKAGYALSVAYIPAQEIDQNGVIRIVIVEGSINEIIYSGNVAALSKRTKRQFEKLTAETPLTVATLERYILLANDIPGLNVSTTIDRADQGAGNIRLLVNVDHKIIEGHVGIGNRGSSALGPILGDIGFTFNNLGPLDGYISGLASHTIGQNELAYYSLSTGAFINDEGTKIDLSLSRVNASPGVPTLELLEFNTDSWIGSVGVNHPLIRSRSRNAAVWTRFDFKNSDGEMLGFSTSNENIRSLRFGGQYDWVSSEGTITLLQGQLSQGIGIFGATKNGSPLINRQNADFNYRSFKFDVSQFHHFDDGFGLSLRASAQYSGDALIGSEQCGFGGNNYGRAYDNFEISGDKCVIGSAEISKNLPRLSNQINNIQPYVFWDAGKVWLNQSNISSFSHAAGAGVRATFFQYVNGYAELAVPLKQAVSLTNSKSPRFFMGIRSFF